MSKKSAREATGKLGRFPNEVLVLATDSGHVWFLDVDENRVSHLVGLRVTVRGDRVGRTLRVTGVIQA